MKRRPLLRVLGTGMSVGVFAGCTSSDRSPTDAEPVDGTLVEMTDGNRFEPETVTVPVGETVVWRNVGAAAHSVTAYEDEILADAAYFSSGGLGIESAAIDGYGRGIGRIDGNERYEHAFDVPGRYEYFCIPHESSGMKGTVVGGEAGSSDDTAGAVARRDRRPRGVRRGTKRPGVARPPETIARRPV